MKRYVFNLIHLIVVIQEGLSLEYRTLAVPVCAIGFPRPKKAVTTLLGLALLSCIQIKTGTYSSMDAYAHGCNLPVSPISLIIVIIYMF